LSIKTTKEEQVNVVTLIGHLATDVELRDVGEERQLATFLLAVDRNRAAGGADFVPVAVWNKQAEVCSRHLSRGSQIGLDGRLRSRSWEDAEGKQRNALEVVAHSVQFLSRANGAGSEPPFEPAAPLSERSMA
jgi:single-strand DNA-binding protein